MVLPLMLDVLYIPWKQTLIGLPTQIIQHQEYVPLRYQYLCATKKEIGTAFENNVLIMTDWQ